MNAALSKFFVFAAVILGLSSFVYLYCACLWNFISSVVVSALMAGVLFASSIFFDRRDALDLAEPAMKWKGGGRKVGKYQMLLGWMLKNPNTVDLFAITALILSVGVIGWRLHQFLSDRLLHRDAEE